MTSVPLVGKLTAPPILPLNSLRGGSPTHHRQEEGGPKDKVGVWQSPVLLFNLASQTQHLLAHPLPRPSPAHSQGTVNWEALLIPLPSQASAQGATRHHPPWQIRLSGGHLAGELLLLQLEKDNGGPWQRTWFWGVFHRDTWWKTKATPHPSCWHSAEASWGILQSSWLQPQLELHTVLLTLPLWTSSIP